MVWSACMIAVSPLRWKQNVIANYGDKLLVLVPP